MTSIPLLPYPNSLLPKLVTTICPNPTSILIFDLLEASVWEFAVFRAHLDDMRFSSTFLSYGKHSPIIDAHPIPPAYSTTS